MQLGALLLLMPIVAAAVTILDRALQRAAIEDRGRWLLVSPFPKPNQSPQVGHDGLEDPGGAPPGPSSAGSAGRRCARAAGRAGYSARATPSARSNARR